MSDWLGNLWQNVAANAVTAAIAFVAGGAYLRLSARRRFRVRNPDQVTVVVSASAATRTDHYVRPATGVGQVRAIADLSPRFAYAYWRRRLDQVFTSDVALYDRALGDLIVIGGEKTNQVTLEILELLAAQAGFPVTPCPESKVVWRERAYASSGDGSNLVKDYGVVVRAKNPLDDSGRSTVVILAGASTQGTHAAAKAFLRNRWFGRSGDLAAVIECRVRDGFPIQVSVLDRSRRRSRDTSWHPTR